MRGAIGPILTTGVALATAGVVVTNPIKAPSADVQIPAISLSAGSNDAVSMLDEDFLEAIEPEQSRPTNPFTLLRDLISSLAADATHVGKNAIMEAFVAGVTAVSEPELTAVTTPYLPLPAGPQVPSPVLDSPTAQVFLVPGLDMDAIATAVDVPAADWAATIPNPSAIAESLAPAVDYLVNSTISDVGYVGTELIAAAFTAGVAVAAEPVLIAKTLIALVNGDFEGALNSAVRAVVAPLEAPIIVINAVQTVVERRLADLRGQPASLPAVSPSGAEEAAPIETPADPTAVEEPAVASPPAVTLSAPGAGRDTRPSRAANGGAVSSPGDAEVTVSPTTATPAEPAAVEVAMPQVEALEAPSDAAADGDAEVGAAQVRADATETVDAAAPSLTGGTETSGRDATPRRGAVTARGAAAVADAVRGAVSAVAGVADRTGRNTPSDASPAAAADGDSGRS